MGASSKPPLMCIIMEYMSLGSLYEVPSIKTMRLNEFSCLCVFRIKVLHNELIAQIPFALKLKIAVRASKGMHFLHSSGDF